MSYKLMLSTAGALFAAVVLTTPAHALSMKECSAKYQEAKTKDPAKTPKWNDFRAKNCGADAAAADQADEKDVTTTAADKEPPAPPKTAKVPKTTTFPKAVDKKYAAEAAGLQRLHTCVDAYHANKDAGTLGDLKWIQAGGGYWSLCNAAIKAGK